MKGNRTKTAAAALAIAVTLASTPARAGQPSDPVVLLALPALVVLGVIVSVAHVTDETQSKGKAGALGAPAAGPSFSTADSALEHLDRLHQTAAHARERFGERSDLVAAAGGEIRRVDIAEADAVRECRDAGHRADEHSPEQQVEDDRNCDQDGN